MGSRLLCFSGVLLMVIVADAFAERRGEDKCLPKILVLAKVAKVEERTKGELSSTLEITRVFRGSPDLIGKKFSVISCKPGRAGGLLAVVFVPPLEEGEVGIWPLHVPQGDQSPLIAWDSFYPRQYFHGPSPARKGTSERYEQALAWAEAVEAFSKADPNEQPALLRKYAVSDVPEVSAWAIHAIAVLKPPDFAEFLENLVSNQQLSVDAQVALDEVLSDLKGESWQQSEQRVDLLQKLVSRKVEEREARIAFGRLSVASQRHQITNDTLLPILKTAISNQGMPMAVRESCCALTGKVANRQKDYGQAFSLLVEVIRGQNEEKIQVQAARAIHGFILLTDERIAVIQSLLRDIRSDKVKEPLLERLKDAGVQVPESIQGSEKSQVRERGPAEQQESVRGSANWLLPGLIIIGVVIAGVVLFLLLRRRKAQ